MSHQPFHYELKNQTSGASEIRMYGYIGKYEEFDYKGFQQLFRDALGSSQSLTIRMHCGGGSVYEGLAIYDLIRNSESQTKVIVEGMAASMGGVIALAGDEIEMNDNAFFMMHAVTAGCFGNKNDLKNCIQQIENCEDRLGKIFAERTNADAEMIGSWLNSGQDHWLDSSKCEELGICDRIIKPVKKRKNVRTTENLNGKSPEDVFNSFTLPQQVPEETIIHQHTDMKKEAIYAALAAAGLAGTLSAVSSDTDFENHLQDILKSAQKTAQLENELKEFKKTQAETLVSSALKAGKIMGSEKEDWTRDALDNYALVAKSLERMPGKPDPNAGLERLKPAVEGARHELLASREDWSYSQWQEKDPAGLERLSEEAPEEFEKLFNTEFNN